MRDEGPSVARDRAGGRVGVGDAGDVRDAGELAEQAGDRRTLTAGEVTGRSEWTTTSTVSPDWAGNWRSSSFWAWLESEPGAE